MKKDSQFVLIVMLIEKSNATLNYLPMDSVCFYISYCFMLKNDL